MAFNPVTDTPFNDTSIPVDELLVSDIPSTIRSMKVRINEVVAGLYASVATVGEITIWPFDTLPSNGNYLELNGGTTLGHDKLTALFGANLPDYRGFFLRGWSHGNPTSPDPDTGRTMGSIQGWAVGAHKHRGVPQRVGDITGSDNDSNIQIKLRDITGETDDNNTLQDNRPTNIAVMYIVRAQ